MSYFNACFGFALLIHPSLIASIVALGVNS